MRANVLRLLALGAVMASLVYAGTVGATPQSGFTGTTIATGRFGDLDINNHSFFPAAAPGNSHPGNNLWLSLQKTKGPSDLYVQNNTWVVGGTTGWHTHPGHSLIIVTAGTVTAYEGDDASCTPHQYTVGQGFVDEGGDHVHLLRNEGVVEARTVAVQLVPAGAVRRIDAPAPSNCTVQ